MKLSDTDAAYTRFQEWERVARDDEEMMQIGLKEGSPPNPLCFHAQQMAEKLLKGFLAYHKQPPMKIHQLDQPLIACERIDSSFKHITDAILYLNEFYIETRYPGDYPAFTSEDAQQAYERALEIAEFVRSKIVSQRSNRDSSRSVPALAALLFLAVLSASLALAPWAVWGQEGNQAEKGSGEEATKGTGSEYTQIEEIREQRFGLNAVASLLGLTECENPDYTKCPAPDIREVVLKLIQVALGFTSLLVLIFVLYGGFTWTTAAGNAERVDKGRKILLWAGAGLVAVLLAWSVVTYVLYTASRVVA